MLLALDPEISERRIVMPTPPNVCIDCGRALAARDARRCQPCAHALFAREGAMPSIRMVSSPWTEEPDGSRVRQVWNAAADR
jgi:hypothetical protein